MLKAITKAVAYFKAPVTTFVVLHPLKAVKWGGVFLLVGAALKRSGKKPEAHDGRGRSRERRPSRAPRARSSAAEA